MNLSFYVCRMEEREMEAGEKRDNHSYLVGVDGKRFED